MLELNSLKILIIVIITVIEDLKILLGLNILNSSFPHGNLKQNQIHSSFDAL